MSGITLVFGPDEKYTFTLAVTEENKASLLRQFQQAVAQLTEQKPKKLKTGYLPTQQLFAFCK